MNAILLDLMMPEMDGFEVLLRLKEDANLRGIPVLVLTAKELSSRTKCNRLRQRDHRPFPEGQGMEEAVARRPAAARWERKRA